MTKQQTEDERKDPWPDVLAAVAALQQGHEVGRGVLKDLGEVAPRGKIAESAQAYGYTVDALRKLRQFALTYTDDELAELCELCRTHERALGLVFVYRLVSIKSKTRRAAFQRKAIREHWGHARFVRELQRSFKLGHPRGRQARLPETVPEAVAEIHDARKRFIGLLSHCVDLAEEGEGRGKEKEHLRQVAQQLLDAIEGVEAPSSSPSRKIQRRRTRGS